MRVSSNKTCIITIIHKFYKFQSLERNQSNRLNLCLSISFSARALNSANDTWLLRRFVHILECLASIHRVITQCVIHTMLSNRNNCVYRIEEKHSFIRLFALL